ncbi:DUF2768 family protein [Ammoniphilus oxalaticus]|uniref:DUF2768 family protein n=1 Tax=Ammoniphilus oxalaticus TaxID=66863 RepID=UPI001FE56590|nr:DUF2768 family protein [Ammoniphilus oxalaticus]
MDKEMASLVAIGLMFLANVLIVFARKKLRGFFRFSVSFIAFILLLPSFLLILAVLL